MVEHVLSTWKRLKTVPGGAHIFNQIFRKMIPYTGTINPRVLELRPGFAKLEIKDRRAVRNHLKSIHAAALMNLAEAASGLAFNISIPQDARAILVGFNIEYLKKARGTLTAEATTPILTSSEVRDVVLESIVRDSGGNIVAKARASWRVGPNPNAKPISKPKDKQ